MKKGALWLLAACGISYSILLPAHAFAQAADATTTPVIPAMSTTTVATTTPAIPPAAPVPPVRNVHNAADVERQVRAAFAGIPVMADIARCESRFRQFADSGNVFRGGTDNQMIGIFQIYSSVHRAFALSLGMDIDTIEGNIRYARYLYDRERTNPWVDSISCWNTKPAEEGSVPVPASPLAFTLTFGMVHPEVVTLQRILNAGGYVIAPAGPGSPGNETDRFGALTRAAVRQFQCTMKIVCGGDEYTTSYGTVGPRTRQALAVLAAGGAGGMPAPVPSPSPAPVPDPALPPQPDPAEAARIAAIRAQIEALKKQISSLEAQIPR